MRVLLDTHWFVLGDARLSTPATQCILEAANAKLVSPASYWEIAIKISLGKYVLTEPYLDFMRNAVEGNGFEILPIAPVGSAPMGPRPCCWLFSQPSFCLAMFTTKPIACSNEWKFGNAFVS